MFLASITPFITSSDSPRKKGLAMTHTHWLDRQDEGDVTIVRFRLHRLSDDDDTREVFQMMHQLVDVMRRTKIILNLGEVDYLASLAIARIVLFNRKVESVGGTLALCLIGERVRNVLRITHIDDLLKIYASEADALAAITANGAVPAAHS